MTAGPASTDRPVRPRTAWRRWAVAAGLALVTWWSASARFGVGVDPAALVDNVANGWDKLVALSRPDLGFFPHTVPALVETLAMAVVATAVSAALALPLSFLASRVTNASAPLLLAVRAVLNVVRAVPDLLSATILVAMVGVGSLPGVLALLLFDVAIIVKLVSEVVDAMDRGGLEAARAAGATWVQADRAAALPEVLPAFAGHTLYVLELNVRVSAVLGLVGAGGLGLLIDELRTFYRYQALSLVILEILVVVLLLEVTSAALRRRLAG